MGLNVSNNDDVNGTGNYSHNDRNDNFSASDMAGKEGSGNRPGKTLSNGAYLARDGRLYSAETGQHIANRSALGGYYHTVSAWQAGRPKVGPGAVFDSQWGGVFDSRNPYSKEFSSMRGALGDHYRDQYEQMRVKAQQEALKKGYGLNSEEYRDMVEGISYDGDFSKAQEIGALSDVDAAAGQKAIDDLNGPLHSALGLNKTPYTARQQIADTNELAMFGNQIQGATFKALGSLAGGVWDAIGEALAKGAMTSAPQSRDAWGAASQVASMAGAPGAMLGGAKTFWDALDYSVAHQVAGTGRKSDKTFTPRDNEGSGLRKTDPDAGPTDTTAVAAVAPSAMAAGGGGGTPFRYPYLSLV